MCKTTSVSFVDMSSRTQSDGKRRTESTTKTDAETSADKQRHAASCATETPSMVDASSLKEKEQGGGSFQRGREDESVDLYVEDELLLSERGDDDNEENRREKERGHKQAATSNIIGEIEDTIMDIPESKSQVPRFQTERAENNVKPPPKRKRNNQLDTWDPNPVLAYGPVMAAQMRHAKRREEEELAKRRAGEEAVRKEKEEKDAEAKVQRQAADARKEREERAAEAMVQRQPVRKEKEGRGQEAADAARANLSPSQQKVIRDTGNIVRLQFSLPDPGMLGIMTDNFAIKNKHKALFIRKVVPNSQAHVAGLMVQDFTRYNRRRSC